MSHLATGHPERVAAVVYLDALFPKLAHEPDFSDDPVWSAILAGGPQADDLVSREAYLVYYRRARPAWDKMWCEAIEADLMDKVSVRDDGRLDFHHDDGLMNCIYRTVWLSRNPEYGQVKAPMLAIVPDGQHHQAVPPDAEEELRSAADRYWIERRLPWIRQRTEVFCAAAPTASVVELDTPYHHVYIGVEEETVAAIHRFVERIQNER